MHTIWQDVRYAIRMLTKNPAFSFVAILSLALGIGANTTIFTVVNAILLNPLPVKDISRIVELDTVDTKTRVTAANIEKLGMSYVNFQDYARQTPQLFSAMTCVVGPFPFTWSGGAEPRQTHCGPTNSVPTRTRSVKSSPSTPRPLRLLVSRQTDLRARSRSTMRKPSGFRSVCTRKCWLASLRTTSIRAAFWRLLCMAG